VTIQADPRIREVGVPVRSVNRALLYAGKNKTDKPCLYGTMSQQAENFFLLQIDPETGEFRQMTPAVPESNYTTAAYMSRSGKFYIGAAHSGQLFCFDPEREELLDLGTINPEMAIFPIRIDEDSKGTLWISSYGTADLTSFDPESGEFARYGRMDEIDMYASCFVNVDDTIACMIYQTRPHVVVLDPMTGDKHAVGPIVTKGEGTLSLLYGSDRQLYIESSEGNFRIDGMEAVPVEDIPHAAPEMPTLADGSTFRYADAEEQIHRHLEITKPDGSIHTFYLDYNAAGTDIFCLHGGFDECIYGSSILPEHLFRYNPKSEELIDLGICSRATGEAYSMANHDGRIYISSYPGASVSIYDPSQGYAFGEESDSNPRDIGRIDDISYRPRSTLGGPGGKVWFASIPDYGRWGGPLACYDPATRKKKAFYRIAGDGSCYTLAHLEAQGLIAVGTSISGGTGTQPKVNQAMLFLFDYEAEEKIWEGTLDRHISVYNALVTGPNGKLYCAIRGEEGAGIVLFDPEEREFIDRVTSPEDGPVDNGLQNGPDGKIYGLTNLCIFRLDPSSLEVEEIVVFPEPLGGHAAAGPIVDGQLYYSSGHRLMAARIL
jgi:streptogramin lyase